MLITAYPVGEDFTVNFERIICLWRWWGGGGVINTFAFFGFDILMLVNTKKLSF